ncbi:NAD(P)/FAD-dependent oxidoreductase [Kitasatospora sp. NBC_01302]|uniref:NAD(P)/FAD-dependent oxidoreductase n=1 Tax=Kitasatospora sp. NBC_01302 TaxID=2903575 RepID=UPI002E14F570|nr:FAD-dependent oxidoreductase [Kitasatospora sp. NBC_01302]
MRAGSAVDVVVVGAGLAGLACALDVARAGLSVQVLEASDRVGGRMCTDVVDGFRLDRGFQVFNTSYPQVKRRVDLRALRLRPFTPGFVLAGARGRFRFADPSRRPDLAADLLPGRLAPLGDVLALGLISARDLVLPAAVLRRGRDVPTDRALRAAGVSAATVDQVLRPFLAGIFLEDALETSSRVFHLYWRSMLRGTLCLPAAGIGAVPEQLAAGLPPGVLRLGAAVAEVTDDGVRLADDSEIGARAVVVATDAQGAARLLPGLTVPPTRAVTTFYHAVPGSPLREPVLVVDSDGTLLNSVVLSEVVPGLSPDGRALISTSVLGVDAEEATVRARLAQLYETDTSGWQPLAEYRIAAALPAMPAPRPLTRSTRVIPGRSYVCGDHRGTGSVQGALASGARAAREVLADLAAGRAG